MLLSHRHHFIRPQHGLDCARPLSRSHPRQCAVCLDDEGVALDASPWHNLGMDATLVLGQQGRLVIPAEVRAALGLRPGDRLNMHVVGGRLVLERPQDAMAELRALGASVPQRRSLVEELLAERRAAAVAE